MNDPARITTGPRARARQRSLLPVLALGAMLAGVAVMGAGLWVVISARTPETPRPAREQPAKIADAPSKPAAPAPTPSSAAREPRAQEPPRPPSSDPASTLKRLRELPEQWRADRASAIKSWRECVADLGAGWCRADADTLSAAPAAAGQFISIVSLESKSEGLPEVLRPLIDLALSERDAAAHPEITSIHPMILAAGILGRAVDRQDIRDPETRREIAGRLEDRFGPVRSNGDAFTDHAAAAMARIAASLLTPRAAAALPEDREEAWRRWLAAAACLRAGGPSSADIADNAVLGAAERLLASKPPPSLDMLSRRVLGLLLAAIDWNKSDPAKARLLAWFDSADIPTSELAEAAAILAQETPPRAPAVAQAGALQPTASAVERSAVRRQLARAWGIEQAREIDLAAEQWGDECDRRLSRPAPTGGPTAMMADAAAFSLLSAAGAALWRDDQSAARDWLRAAGPRPDEAAARDTDPARAAAQITLLTAPAARPDGEWSARYFGAGGNHDARLQLVTEMLRSPKALAPADADALAHASILGATPELRAAAQQAAKAQRGNLAMLHALLEQSVQLPRQEGVSELISELTLTRLPNPEDAHWPGAARAALIARLVALASRDTHGAIDQLAAILRDAAEQQTDDPGASSAAAARAGEDPAPEASLATLRAQWVRRAQSLVPGPWARDPLEAIENAAAARRTLASGPIRAYAAEQASLVDIMAYVVSGERPSRAAACRTIVDEFRAAARGASSVFAQINAGERAIVRLWRVRLGREAPEGGA